MLQLKIIKENPEWVKERLAIRNIDYSNMVDGVLHTDEFLREKKSVSEKLQSEMNNLSKDMGLLLAKGEAKLPEDAKVEVAALKQKVASLKQQFVTYKDDLLRLENQFNEMMLSLPNLPHMSVPPGKTPADNIVVRAGGTEPKLSADALPHWDLIKKYDIVDFETGAKITGSGFPLYKGKGAKLQRALIQYFLDFNTAAGYTEYLPPFMVNEASAFGTGQLPDKEGQMYYMQADNFYMIPTAEVPVTNIYRDEIVKEDTLPIKMTAYTPCFRREAGSFGKDVRGLNRVHQFDKVEIVQLVHPEKSYEVLEEMVSHIEKLLNTLGLPYRILKLCGGDISFASALTYDFEVFSAAQQKWLEVSSVSNFESFQTNRMKIRFKDSNGKMQLAHSLNGSSLALPRIVACLLENNQTANGIKIPLTLQSYFGAESI
ncbi:MAG TPA: serine--tRNA ligase [Chitinophagaceae bacterium]|nr:serine--tRNA ligase [Chitinophagaceae bacterium]